MKYFLLAWWVVAVNKWLTFSLVRLEDKQGRSNIIMTMVQIENYYRFLVIVIVRYIYI